MSYTLRGRIETRLAAALLPFCRGGGPVTHPARLVAARAGGRDARVGLALDVALLHRFLP